MNVVYVAGATLALLVGWFFSLGWLLDRPGRKARTRATRRGGYVKPPASAATKDGGLPTLETATTARIKCWSQPGPALTGAVIRTRLAPPSRLFVPTSFGVVTVDHGANGAHTPYAEYELLFRQDGTEQGWWSPSYHGLRGPTKQTERPEGLRQLLSADELQEQRDSAA